MGLKGDIMSQIKIKKINYGQYGDCVQISNDKVDLVITVEVGPRIIRYGFTGEENEFCEGAQKVVSIGNDEWKIRGGHRLWHSPESKPRSYMPDNDPVEWWKIENGIKVSQKIDHWVQIKKEMEITLSPDTSKVKVVHKLTNKNAWPVELAAWGISVMAPGGKQIVPQPQRDTGLLANRVLTLWPYTKMNDPRVYWGDKYITLKQDSEMKTPIKFGISNEDGWAAYLNNGKLFLKQYEHKLNAKYPDSGMSYETYATDFMMEMESLSPLTMLEPESSLSHIENWKLIKNIKIPPDNKEEIDNIVSKINTHK